jgi:hypothetical protein
VGTGPAWGRRQRAYVWRAAFACGALIAFASPAAAQYLGDSLLNPKIGAFISSQDLPLRRTSQALIDAPPAPPAPPSLPDPNDPRPRKLETPAESRIGKVPSYGLPAASGAKEAGYDSLGRKRKQPKYYPAQVKPKKTRRSRFAAAKGPAEKFCRPASPVGAAVGNGPQAAAAARDGRHRAWPAGAAAHQGR